MGQRFQIIVNDNKDIRIYHIQWLWSDYAIRRIGTAIRNYNKDNMGYRGFYDYLLNSFFGNVNDMNTISPYFEDNIYNDNKEFKKGSIQENIKLLDNNDGICYLEIKENKIKSYCFFYADGYKEDFYCINFKEYLKKYDRIEGFNKTQLKEFERGKETFKKLKYKKIDLNKNINENGI